MKPITYQVNLDLPPSERWLFLKDHRLVIESLITTYLSDFAGDDIITQNLEMYKLAIVPKSYQEEISSIASMTKFSENQVLMANLYYDILKFYFGCTAFATYSGGKMWHARNLDWHSNEDLLRKHTAIFEFVQNGAVLYKTVGWPGYIGALSGIRPGCFSVTLNAVLSNDAPEIAYPISFLLRDVLEEESNFVSARDRLTNTTIASDCLLLLSGVENDEKVVIERTPKRSAHRGQSDDFVVVTNDYKVLDNSTPGTAQNTLQATSCGRFDSAGRLLSSQEKYDEKTCMAILKNPDVMMEITMQQMVFHNKTGEISLE